MEAVHIFELVTSKHIPCLLVSFTSKCHPKGDGIGRDRLSPSSVLRRGGEALR